MKKTILFHIRKEGMRKYEARSAESNIVVHATSMTELEEKCAHAVMASIDDHPRSTVTSEQAWVVAIRVTVDTPRKGG